MLKLAEDPVSADEIRVRMAKICGLLLDKLTHMNLN